MTVGPSRNFHGHTDSTDVSENSSIGNSDIASAGDSTSSTAAPSRGEPATSFKPTSTTPCWNLGQYDGRRYRFRL